MRPLLALTVWLAATTPAWAAPSAAPSAAAGGDRPLARMTLPLEAQSKHGKPGGPINVVIVAAPGRVEDALNAAGWTRADKTTPRSALKIAKDVVERKPYPAAPVSAAYLFGRKQDEAWEREVNDPRVRDHLRLWDAGHPDARGRHLYAIDATKDVGVGRKPHTLEPTHKVDPDVDREAAKLLADLQKAGRVATSYELPGMGPGHHKDAAGNPYVTHGRVRVIVLK